MAWTSQAVVMFLYSSSDPASNSSPERYPIHHILPFLKKLRKGRKKRKQRIEINSRLFLKMKPLFGDWWDANIKLPPNKPLRVTIWEKKKSFKLVFK